jgi:hypothetical protein
MLLLPEADTICDMTQRTFAELNWASKSKTTRRERFLADMERVVPWKELEEVVSRHLLEEHKLQEKLMRRVTRMFSEKGIMTKNGTIVDATIIHAPTSKTARLAPLPSKNSRKRGFASSP